ncbi:MAG: dihydrolipoyllysine-residue succinyltransferase [SAR116 cluster bacterium]|nr:dihydrolipoyllysine-residue succinyltransferase [SAR116 cluster bacterium]
MTIELLVPALGESVVEATVAKWMKSSGDTINADEPIVELETEKVTLEVPSPISGVLKEIVANEGDNVEVGALLGVISDSLNDVQPPNNSNQEKKLEENSSNTHTNTEKKNSHLSPAVKRIVTENDLNPAEIIPSGKDGLITKGDALNKLSNQDLPTQLQSHDNRDPQEERVPMSRLRKVVAKRLKEAQNTAAMLTTFNEVDMSSVMSLRSEYKDDFEKEHKIRLGFMGMFVKASIAALKTYPAVNAEINGDDIVYKNYNNIGVAVGTPQGLVVPVIKNAQNLSLSEIEKSINDMGQRAKDGKIGMDELSGGTFTISNGGVFGSLMSTPILNPPQSGILGMHKIQKRPVAINDNIEIRPMMYLAFSYDHRIIDGREAVSFLVKIKEIIEDPRRLILDI